MSHHKASELEQLEHDFYELKPYLFAGAAVLCFYFKAESAWLLPSGILFGLAAVSIFYMRYFSRNYR